MYMNRITLIGFTGQDAKAAATQTGKEVTRFSLAATKRYQQDSRTEGEDVLARLRRLWRLRYFCGKAKQGNSYCDRGRVDVP
jgi:Single-strand binding protein family